MKMGNGMGSIYKMSGKRRRPWRVRVTKGWTEEGKQIYFNVGYFATKKEGLIALSNYLENPYDIQKSITFAELYDKWFVEKEKTHTKKNMDLYALSFKYCEPLHNKPFAEIKKAHLQGLLDELDKSYALKSRIKSLLNQMFKFAIENDIVNKNFARYIVLKNTDEEKEQIIFTKQHIDYLFDIADKDITAKQVLILLYTGTRINEFLELKTANVNLEEGYVIGGFKTEAGTDRPIIIHDKIMPFVKEYYDKGCETLLVNQNGKPIHYRTFYNAWYKKLKEWGFPITNIHSTRHTFSSMAYEAGVDELALKRHIGHAESKNITNHYTHLSIEYLRNEINKIY